MMVYRLDDRWWLDISWFIVVLVVIFNVVSGIIIMTFASLREEKAVKENDIHGRCFVCGIEKDVFEKAAGGPEGFKSHIKTDQNMWNYLYFMIFIWEQDKDDDDGLEWYVRKCIETNDLSWFPINFAMCLNQGEDNIVKMINELQSDVKNVDHALISNISHLKNDISSSLENMIDLLKSDSKIRENSKGGSLAKENNSSTLGYRARTATVATATSATPSQGTVSVRPSTTKT